MISGEIQSVYVMWKRIMVRLVRAKGRLVTTFVQPLLFLIAFGLGLKGPKGGTFEFVLPGVVAMGVTMSSAMAGISLMWDREFGFLKEVFVAPVSRASAVIGRVLGALTTAFIQAVWTLLIGVGMGANITWNPLAFVYLMLTATVAVGIGIFFASFIEDFESFQIVQNLIIMPMIFLSTAFVNSEAAPAWLANVTKFNPLSYGIDGARFYLTGIHSFPIFMDIVVSVAVASLSIFVATWAFQKIEL